MASSTIANVNGQPTWQISSASVSSFSTTTNAAVNKPEVSFSVNFTNMQPIDLLVTDLAFGAGATDAELKALFDPLIINNTGINWNGFRIDLVDIDSGTGGPLHPNWAHFHDSTLAGWLSPFTGVFPYNPNEGDDRTTKLRTYSPCRVFVAKQAQANFSFQAERSPPEPSKVGPISESMNGALVVRRPTRLPSN